MVRKACLVIAVLAAAAGASAAHAADAAHLKGLWLTTNYPAVVARAGETTTLRLQLRSYDLPPERVALSVDGVPKGWTVELRGNGMPVDAAMPVEDGKVPLSLRVDVPEAAAAGAHRLVLHAKGSDAATDLPIDIAIGEEMPPQLAIKAQLPSLQGTPTTNFSYQFTVRNDGDQNLLVKLGAETPPGFQANFTEAYGSQQLSSIPIEAGKSKDLKVSIQPPPDVAAKDYPVLVTASAKGVSAHAALTMEISGQPMLHLSGRNGRVSADAEAGHATPISLVVSNDGTAPADDVRLSGSPPEDWKVVFQPDQIREIAPHQKAEVQALLTPSAQALAGDYMTSFSATGKDNSASADFRITVSTSTLWGMAGIAIIAIALLVAVGAVARFGRR